MPIFEYKCPACGAKVERIVKRSEADEQRCEGDCHADEAEQRPLLEREQISATAAMPEQWKVR